MKAKHILAAAALLVALVAVIALVYGRARAPASTPTLPPATACAPVEAVPPLSAADEEAVRQAVQREIYKQQAAGRGGKLEIMSVRGEGEWAVIDSQPLSPSGDTSFSSEGTILIAYVVREGAAKGSWSVAYPGTAEFNRRLEQLPNRAGRSSPDVQAARRRQPELATTV